jgi:hypothetical protein
MKVLSSTSARDVAAPIAAGVAVAMLIVWLMASALHSPAPHGLRVALVAPDQAASAVAASLEKKQPGAFTIVRYDTREAAKAAIDDRSVAGAVIVGTGAVEILVSSGDSEASAAAISGAFSGVAAGMSAAPTVTDVHPLPNSDPHGIVPFFLVLAVSISGLVFGAAASLMGGASGLMSKLGSAFAFAVLDGLGAAVVVGFVVGFEAELWLLAGVCACLALAVAAATMALRRLVGLPGLALSAVFVVLLGMASSGGMVGPSFLADGFRELAGLLPPSAGLAAARSALYFDGGGVITPLAVLAIWIVVAVALVVAVEVWTSRRGATRKPAVS